MEVDLSGSVAAFVRDRVVPAEPALHRGGSDAARTLLALQDAARREGLWGRALPKDLGGGGLELAAFAPVAEAEGFSDYGPGVFGSDLLLDITMLRRHASAVITDTYVRPMVDGLATPSFGMTEPGTSGSHPAGLLTQATFDGRDWVINGRKWFISRAASATFMTVLCRTETSAPGTDALSLIVVPTSAPGYTVLRSLPVLGGGCDQYEVDFHQVRVPGTHLLGERGAGMAIVAERLGLGRTLRCLRWLGQTRRAFDLLCRRMADRRVQGGLLADKQLLHRYVFDSHAELLAARAATYAAVETLAGGGETRVAVATAKVVTAQAFHAIVDRAIQIHGAEGLTDDTPLAMLHRTARAARILDGPDELHITTVARRLLAPYQSTEST